MNKLTPGEMEQCILNDGYSIAIVSQMSNEELNCALSYDDFDEYSQYMHHICHKYESNS